MFLENQNSNFVCKAESYALETGLKKDTGIEEGLNQKTRQGLSHQIGGQNPCRASCFTSVILKQTV